MGAARVLRARRGPAGNVEATAGPVQLGDRRPDAARRDDRPTGPRSRPRTPRRRSSSPSRRSGRRLRVLARRRRVRGVRVAQDLHRGAAARRERLAGRTAHPRGPGQRAAPAGRPGRSGLGVDDRGPDRPRDHDRHDAARGDPARHARRCSPSRADEPDAVFECMWENDVAPQWSECAGPPDEHGRVRPRGRPAEAAGARRGSERELRRVARVATSTAWSARPSPRSSPARRRPPPRRPRPRRPSRSTPTRTA